MSIRVLWGHDCHGNGLPLVAGLNRRVFYAAPFGMPQRFVEGRTRQDMPASNLFPLLAAILGVWAVGIFLVLPRHDQTVRREIRLGGVAMIGASLAALALLFGTEQGAWPKPLLGFDQPELRWWGESELDDFASAATFFIFAAGSLGSAMIAVFAGESAYCLRAFAVTLAFTGGLFAFHGSLNPTIVCLVLAIGLFGTTVKAADETVRRSGVDFDPEVGTPQAGRDPALTAFAGFLLATSLIGTISYALVHESGAAGLNSGPSSLPIVFPTAAAGSDDNAKPRYRRDRESELGIEDYWILPAVVAAMAVCAASGLILVARQSASSSAEEGNAIDLPTSPPASLR